jgi:predicted transposase YbfD/YdcC
MSNFVTHFSHLEDKRVQGRTDYPLLELLFLCICAILSGSDGWEDIEDWGIAKLVWLRKYLAYENGIPCHDTIARVISRISPVALQKGFIEWIKSVAQLTQGEIIAIDGKRSRGSYDRRSRKEALHMVSAWACQNGVVLGQQKTADKSNEITAIPALLELLELKGCIVTIDAMGCQKAIAQKIVEGGADYVLALKGNQGELHDSVTDFFKIALENNFKNIEHDKHSQVDGGHGRIEERVCYAVAVPDYLTSVTKPWKKLQTLICIQSIREYDDKKESETRCYISSLPKNAQQCAHAVRAHWGVENKLHWVLDVTFKEDDSRIRREHAAHNFTVMRHIALNLIKRETTKMSVPRKRKKANYYDDYRDIILKGL